MFIFFSSVCLSLNLASPPLRNEAVSKALTRLDRCLGASTYIPGIPQTMIKFHVSQTAAIVPLTVYLIGFSLGPLISAPLSEVFGRRIVYFTVFPIFLLFTLGVGLSENFGSLIVLRFFAGMFGASAMSVVAGTALDLWERIDLGRAAMGISVVIYLGPSFGPLIGGYAATDHNWRWTQWVIMIMGGAIYIASLLQKETYRKILNKKRAARLGIPQPPAAGGGIKLLLTVVITRPTYMLITEPVVTFTALYSSLLYAILYGFFAAIPYIFQTVYGFSIQASGLVWLGQVIGCLIATTLFVTVDYFTVRRKYFAAKNLGQQYQFLPEQRLASAMVGSIFPPIGLFWLGWSARADIHWIMPVIGSTIFMAGNLMVFVSLTKIPPTPV